MAAAFAGLCLAVGLAILTSHLSTQRIGLAGESPTVGQALVAPAKTPVRRPTKTGPPATTTVTTPVQTTTDDDNRPGGGSDDPSGREDDRPGRPDRDD